MAVGIQSPLIADSDGVLVMVLAVGTDLGFGATKVNAAILLYVVVVADVFPATVVHVVVAALLRGITGVTSRRTAM